MVGAVPMLGEVGEEAMPGQVITEDEEAILLGLPTRATLLIAANPSQTRVVVIEAEAVL